jgi:amino acid transporter
MALFINYFTDRFSLMRSWKRSPHLGSEIARTSRKVVYALAIVMMAVVASLFWSGFPFDNLCSSGEEVASIDMAYIGNFTITPSSEEESDIRFAIESTDKVYNYCVQNLLKRGFGFSFPFLPSKQEGRGGEWMTEEQEEITTVFGWCSVVIAGFIFAKIVYGFLVSFYQRYHVSYKVSESSHSYSLGLFLPHLYSPVLIIRLSEKTRASISAMWHQ